MYSQFMMHGQKNIKLLFKSCNTLEWHILNKVVT